MTDAACFRIVDFVVGVDITLFYNRTASDPDVDCGHLCRAGDSCTVNIGRFLSPFLLGFQFIVSCFLHFIVSDRF